VNTRGAVPLIILAYMGITALLGYAGYKGYQAIAPGRNKDKADAAAVAAVQTQSQATTVKAVADAVEVANKQSAAAHVAVVAARDAIDDGVNGRIECAKTMLATDKDPTAAEAAALIMLDDAQKALGRELTPAERTYWTKLAVPIIQKQQEALAEAQKQREIAAKAIAVRDAVQEESAKKDVVMIAQGSTIKEQAGKLVVSATRSAKLNNEIKAWADDSLSAWQRVQALGCSVGILAVVAGLILIKCVGFRTALHDAVGLAEHIKDTAIEGGHDAAAMAASIKTWWGGDKNEKVVADITTNILRK